MSAHIPFEVQEEIMKRLPVKILIQFKMVSKPWKALIESSEFMANYNISQTGPHHLFMRYDRNSNREKEHVSVLDDNKTFPQHRFVHTLPESLKLLYIREEPRIVGSSHRLFCLYGYSISACKFNIVIWNPSINKCIVLDTGEHFDGMSKIGFGVLPDTLDLVIVMINNDKRRQLPWSVEVFRLSTGVWTNRRLNRPIRFTSNDQVDVNGFIYYCVFYKGIVSFDMKSEKFIEVKVPKCLTSKWLHISKIRESLGVLDYYEEAESQKRVCAVWMMMENGVQKLFKKLYTISTQAPISKVPGFRNCGKPSYRGNNKC